MDSKAPRSGGRDEGLDAYMQSHGYIMGRIVGEGSYSKVKYVVRNFPNGTPAYRLACKIIDKRKASDEFVKKFLPRELQIMTRLDHPNIIRVFDIVEFNQQVYLFMDLCDKGDLLEYIKSKGQLSEARSRLYFQQLLSAVNYLHSLDLAHRDLKCENVLLGAKDTIKISDFGFARYCRDDSGKRILSNTYCGSAAYAAPEILQGTSYNPKLYDMWSLGCVLFIMLTGHMPFDESNIPKMLQYQLERKLIYPNGLEEELSEAPKSLIRRLLEPDVTRRQTVNQAWNHQWLTMGFRPVTAPSEGESLFGGGDTGKIVQPRPSGQSTRTYSSQQPASASTNSSRCLKRCLQSPSPRSSMMTQQNSNNSMQQPSQRFRKDENYPPQYLQSHSQSNYHALQQQSHSHHYQHQHQHQQHNQPQQQVQQQEQQSRPKYKSTSTDRPQQAQVQALASQKVKPRFTTGKYAAPAAPIPQAKIIR